MRDWKASITGMFWYLFTGDMPAGDTSPHNPEHLAHLQRIVDGLEEEVEQAWAAYEAACDDLSEARTELEVAQGVWKL